MSFCGFDTGKKHCGQQNERLPIFCCKMPDKAFCRCAMDVDRKHFPVIRRRRVKGRYTVIAIIAFCVGLEGFWLYKIVTEHNNTKDGQ